MVARFTKSPSVDESGSVTLSTVSPGASPSSESPQPVQMNGVYVSDVAEPVYLVSSDESLDMQRRHGSLSRTMSLPPPRIIDDDVIPVVPPPPRKRSNLSSSSWKENELLSHNDVFFRPLSPSSIHINHAFHPAEGDDLSSSPTSLNPHRDVSNLTQPSPVGNQSLSRKISGISAHVGRRSSYSEITLKSSPEDGVLNKSFVEEEVLQHTEHIDPQLPPVDVIEDVTTAARMPDDIPVIDALVVEGVHLGKEKINALILQIFIPFILAGFGMVGAGLLLDTAQNWAVFVDISEIFIMVPALLGLKGNLEMTLASRLSTQVNIGGFDDARRKWRIIGCNMALNQVLATGVGLLAALFATAMYAINHGGTVVKENVIILLGTALISACSTSIVQDTVMIGTVLLARHFRWNPDNIATPVAGTIGDILTLSILAGFSFLFYSAVHTSYWMAGPVVIMVILPCLLPLWVWLAKKEPTTRHVLLHGWAPVIIAMLISSCSGIILERVLNTGLAYFKGLPVFQPLINGIGGNIVSVQASRISTYLHLAYTTPGHVPPGYSFCHSPCHTFCSRTNVNARTARLLLLMVVPGYLIFLFTISFTRSGPTSLSLRFAFMFLILGLIQVIFLLYVADVLTHLVWKKALDPDSQTIPYLTSMGDLLGTGLLAFGFWLLYLTSKTGDVGAGPRRAPALQSKAKQ